MLDQVWVKVLAGICATAAFVLSIYQIFMHLRYYVEPLFQRQIVRLILTIPIYSIASFLGLLFRENSIYFDTVRDIYEAFVIYSFLSLLLAYVGGPSQVLQKLDGKQFEPHWYCCTCCIPPDPIDGRFLRKCKQGVLQFVWAKPILAAVTLALYATGHYNEGNWSPDQGYIYIQIAYNISYTSALFSLLVFYLGTEEILKPYRPVIKFVLIKSVVFLTFWQGFVLSVLGSTEVMSSLDSKGLQDILVCVEMVFAAACMFKAFPYQEYKLPGHGGNLKGGNILHAVNIHDVVSDTMHHFAPTYHNYVLYSDDADGGMSQENRKHYKIRTFVAVGQETSKRHDTANLLANMELMPQPTFVEKSGATSADVSQGKAVGVGDVGDDIVDPPQATMGGREVGATSGAVGVGGPGELAGVGVEEVKVDVGGAGGKTGEGGWEGIDLGK